MGKPQQSNYSEVVIHVTGMTCSGCAKTVENAVMGIPGAVNCLVGVQEGRAVVRFKSPPVSASWIIDAIEAVGFEAIPEPTEKVFPTILQSSHLRQPLLSKSTAIMQV